MKNILYTIALCLVSSFALAQTQTENYVKNTTYKKPVKTQAEIDALQNDDKIESITYFDGLGRPIQSIARQAGGNYEDIITPIVYDQFGRQVKDYLPFARTTSSLLLDFNLMPDTNGNISILNNFYDAKYPSEWDPNEIPNPFSEKKFDNSPLNRVIKQAAPGEDWKLGNGHEIEMEYLTNIGSTEVQHYEVTLSFANNTYTPTLVLSGYFGINQLYKTITKDENYDITNTKDHTIEEFKNKQGQVVLKRTYNNEVAHDTYYVYDDYGNLTYVLPPKAEAHNDLPNATELSELCYQYVYDSRNRLVEKKIPGKGWEYIVYNDLDQPIMTQDANLRVDNKWLFTKYDVFGRVAYTGILVDGDGFPRYQVAHEFVGTSLYETKTNSNQNLLNTTLYYTDNSTPVLNNNADQGTEIYTINYYDDYNFDVEQDYEASYQLEYMSSNLSLVGNTITKTNNDVNWNAGFKTKGQIINDGYIQWTATQTGKRVMVGLSRTDSAPNDNYNTIDYAIYIGPGNSSRVYVYEEGAIQTFAPTFFVIGDQFKVERIGNQIYYKKNDETFHISNTISTGTLIGDSSFLNIGTSIDDVHIGYSTLGQSITQNAKGLATGSKVRVLGTNNWIHSETYYDQKAQPILVTSNNEFLDTYDAVSTLFDFTGKVIKTQSTHKLDNEIPIVTIDKFTYDHTDRLIRNTKTINGQKEELIAKNTFDEVGQLYKKQVGGNLNGNKDFINVTSGIDITGNVITKTSTTGGWNQGLSTLQSISGDGYVEFKTVNLYKQFMVGLAYTTVDAHYYSIDYAIGVLSDGKIRVYENGVSRGIKSTMSQGDTFSIERRGTTIYYLKNGEPFYRSEVVATLAPMIGDVSIHAYNTKIKDLVLIDLDKGLQTVDYTYNIRGWLKTINDPTSLGTDLFGFKLNYNTTETTNTKKLYNGNISETFWNTASIDPITLESEIMRGYSYNYDALNRIVEANFEKSSGANQNILYNLSGIGYDKNGNINNLIRTGVDGSGQYLALMDDITYSYDGNQLTDVEESGSHNFGFKDSNIQDLDYLYDSNGNMIQDLNKGITNIEYNHLNLPTKVIFNTGNAVGSDNIIYTYDATGVKLEKKVIDMSENNSINAMSVKTTEYANGYIYEKSGGYSHNGTYWIGAELEHGLKMFSQPEGYIEPTSPIGGYDYVYQYKDHLGNIRLSYSDADNNGSIDASTEIISEKNYYPFGLKHKGYNYVINGTHHPYGYGGMEENDELGLGTLDFGARNYNPDLGRWMNIDPLAEQMYSHSPYSYTFNNPIYFYDADGNIPLPQILSYSRLSSPFGLRIDPITGALNGSHGGLDLVAPIGSSVRSAARGKVVKIGWDVRKTKNGKTKGYGRYIVIQHSDGYYSLYGHLEEYGTMVSVGDNVSNGQLIATSGNTGGSTGPHLHFEIIKANSLSGVFNNSNKVNPQSIYDLDVKLHGPTAPAAPDLLTATMFDWGMWQIEMTMWQSEIQAYNESNAAESEPRTPAVSVSTLTPVPITPLPTPSPSFRFVSLIF